MFQFYYWNAGGCNKGWFSIKRAESHVMLHSLWGWRGNMCAGLQARTSDCLGLLHHVGVELGAGILWRSGCKWTNPHGSGSLQSGILNITLGNRARLPTMHVSEMWHFPFATCLLPRCRGEVSSGVDRRACEDPLLLLQRRHGCSLWDRLMAKSYFSLNIFPELLLTPVLCHL